MQEPEIIKEKYSQLVFECIICKKVFKEHGICPECQAILKVKGG